MEQPDIAMPDLPIPSQTVDYLDRSVRGRESRASREKIKIAI